MPARSSRGRAPRSPVVRRQQREANPPFLREPALPHNAKAERAVLGALISDRVPIERNIDLRDSDFFLEPHRRLFGLWLSLREDGFVGDATDKLAEIVAATGELSDVGGVSYIATLCQCVSTDLNLQFDIVHDRARLRELIYLSRAILAEAYDADELTADMVVDRAQERILRVGPVEPASTHTALAELVQDSFDQLSRLQQSRGAFSGVPTGFTRLDEVTGGLQPGALVVLAARPSMGKSAFALNVANHVASGTDAAVAFFSLEATKHSLFTRLWTIDARIDGHRLAAGYLSAEDYSKLTRAMERLAERKILIDDTRNIGLLELRTRARRLSMDHPLKLIIVDDCQRMSRERVSAAKTAALLKELAMELGLPVVVVAGLSNAVDSRRDHRPRLSDLSDGWGLQDYADVVLMIYREEVYNADSDEVRNAAEIIVAKHRDGPTASILLAYLPQFLLFANVEQGLP